MGYQTADPTEDIFGKHAVAPANKVFLLVDEIKGDAMRPLMDKIKNFITCDHFNVNPKGQTMYSVSNMANVLCTTNHINPIELEPEERRFVVFQCKNVKMGDTAYFQQLLEHLKSEKVARAFYQYLKDHVDVSPFLPFQAHRPKTEAYVAMQQRSIPLFYKFLSSTIGLRLHVANEETSGIKASEFFDTYKKWGIDGNYRVSATWSAFGADLRKLMTELEQADPSQDVLTKRRQGGGFVYLVRWAELQQHLERTARFDPNAE